MNHNAPSKGASALRVKYVQAPPPPGTAFNRLLLYIYRSLLSRIYRSYREKWSFTKWSTGGGGFKKCAECHMRLMSFQVFSSYACNLTQSVTKG